MQAPRLDALSHRLATQPQRRELSRGHDSVLPPREPREGWVDFVTHRLTKSTQPSVLPPLVGSYARPAAIATRSSLVANR